MLADAPLMIDHLCDAAEHALRRGARGTSTRWACRTSLNPRMVRGLDYYTKTTFEFVHDGLGAQSGIGGGGRYDGLMAELGGQPLSGIGFGLGVDRTLLALPGRGHDRRRPARVRGVRRAAGRRGAPRLVVLAGELRRAGVRADLAYGGRALKGAMKAADRSGARSRSCSASATSRRARSGVKDLASGEQRSVPLDESSSPCSPGWADQSPVRPAPAASTRAARQRSGSGTLTHRED